MTEGKIKTKLERTIDLIHRSSDRLVRGMRLYERDPSDLGWWMWMRYESWIHFKRTLTLVWMVFRRKV